MDLFAQRFRVVDLGTLRPPGVPQVQGFDTPVVGAHRVNQRGEIVGNSDGEVGGRRGFFWSAASGLRALSLPPGSSEANGEADGVAYDLNDLGHTVGAVRAANTPWYCACLWRGRSRLLLDNDLLPPHPNRESRALAINNRGQVVGESHPGGVFLWEKRRVRFLEGISLPQSINEAGWVLGRAALWREGRLTFLAGSATQASQASVFASSLNDRGQVVGSVAGRPFLWEAGRLRVLGNLPAGPFGRAVAINNHGWVVGTCQDNTSTAAGVEFLWHAGRSVDLRERTVPRAGLARFSAAALNDRGQIAGSGLLHNETRALLLEPI